MTQGEEEEEEEEEVRGLHGFTRREEEEGTQRHEGTKTMGKSGR